MERRWASRRTSSCTTTRCPALDDLRVAGLMIGLLSNSSRDLDEFVAHHGLVADAVLTSRAHGKTKPHESIFRALLELLGVEPAEAAMVGDTIEDDVEGALAVGMQAVLLDREGRYRRSRAGSTTCASSPRRSGSIGFGAVARPNVFAPEFDHSSEREGYRWQERRSGRGWAMQIGGCVYELPEGERTYPYHFHHGMEEWLVVLDGAPTLREPDGERVLRRGDVVCFPTGPEGAHR